MTPSRKNDFTIRKDFLFRKLEDDVYMDAKYKLAKRIFTASVRRYAKANPDKTENSFFKNRSFDKDYLRPVINQYVNAEKGSEAQIS